MSFSPPFLPGQRVTNAEIAAAFLCSTQGGMKRSKKTGTLVLISDPTKLYLDRWEGSMLHYTGMGQVGDQSLDYMQNRTLAQSTSNGVEVFLFDLLKKNEYLFQGRVELAGEPYTEIQADKTGQNRTVWMFPLRLAEGAAPEPIPADISREAYDAREREARKLSKEELQQRLKNRKKGRKPFRSTVRTEYGRDAHVGALVKLRAEGLCELCEQQAPFLNRKKEPFLEVHHVIWLAKGGKDKPENAVALCPNCHRKMHINPRSKDLKHLKAKALMPIP